MDTSGRNINSHGHAMGHHDPGRDLHAPASIPSLGTVRSVSPGRGGHIPFDESDYRADFDADVFSDHVEKVEYDD